VDLSQAKVGAPAAGAQAVALHALPTGHSVIIALLAGVDVRPRHPTLANNGEAVYRLDRIGAPRGFRSPLEMEQDHG
jgi:hypothetical protein